MSFEAERVKIESHFQTLWAASAYATTPVIYDNVSIKRPSTDFLMHQIISGDGTQKEVAGAGPVLHRYVGIVQVDILSKAGSGSATMKKMVDVVSDIYRRRQLVDAVGAVITFRTPSVRNLGVISERYRLIVSCPYYRDIHQ